MSKEFQLKKVPMETLGEYLAAVREHLGFTIEEVSEKTDIYEKFLSYIEDGKYQMLPPDVYVVGFLKKLANLYKLSCEDLLEQYKKERGIVEHNAREKMVAKKTFKSRLKEISITPKILTIGGGAMLGILAFFYILLQVFSVNKTPQLTLLEPQSGSVLKSNSITVKGITEPGMTLEVNGEGVYVLPDGSFETTLSVAPGQKEIAVVSKNKFGKTTEELISLKVEDPQVAGATTEQPTELEVELQFTKETTITIVRDGVELPEEVVPAAATKKIVAADTVVVTTSDAGHTRVKFNGESLGPLGKVGQELTVPFSNEVVEVMNNKTTDEEVINN